MKFASALYALAWLSVAAAIDITGYTSPYCSYASNSAFVYQCPGISQNVCCNFPRGGYQAQGVYFSLLYMGTIGVFYQSSATTSCGGTARGAAVGYSPGVCVNGGTLSNYFGGGAAWFDCTLQCVSTRRRSLSDDDLMTIASYQTCDATVVPTIFGWEGEGVWVLQLDEGDAWDRYNELPVLDATETDAHIENLKTFGAVWYANATDYTVAAARG